MDSLYLVLLLLHLIVLAELTLKSLRFFLFLAVTGLNWLSLSLLKLNLDIFFAGLISIGGKA